METKPAIGFNAAYLATTKSKGKLDGRTDDSIQTFVPQMFTELTAICPNCFTLILGDFTGNWWAATPSSLVTDVISLVVASQVVHGSVHGGVWPGSDLPLGPMSCMGVCDRGQTYHWVLWGAWWCVTGVRPTTGSYEVHGGVWPGSDLPLGPMRCMGVCDRGQTYLPRLQLQRELKSFLHGFQKLVIQKHHLWLTAKQLRLHSLLPAEQNRKQIPWHITLRRRQTAPSLPFVSWITFSWVD